jgi:hypothetical protein
MTARRCLVILLVCLTGAGAGRIVQADPGATAVRVRGRIGRVAAPHYTAALPEVRSAWQAYAIVIEGDHGRGPWRFGARLPIATSSIEQPAGSYVADYTTGNPALHGEWTLPASVPGPDAVARELRLRGGVGLPLAGHGPSWSLVRNRVLAASDAVEGWREPELYQVGVVPLVVSGLGQLGGSWWDLSARLKLSAFLRTSRASLPPDVATRDVGLIPVMTVSGSWKPRPWLAVGASAALAGVWLSPAQPARDVGRSGALQATAAPHLHLLGRRFALGLDVLMAVGGPLRSSVGAGLNVTWFSRRGRTTGHAADVRGWGTLAR